MPIPSPVRHLWIASPSTGSLGRHDLFFLCTCYDVTCACFDGTCGVYSLVGGGWWLVGRGN